MITSSALQLSRKDIEALPNFKRKTRSGEYSASCPICSGVDRFLFWEKEGNYYCRRCEIRGFISDNPNKILFTDEQYQAWRRAEDERKAKERQQQLETIKRLGESSKAELYHRQMTDRSYWYSQGLTDDTINDFKLGYCPSCPTCRESPSWTIPIYYQGQLYNIRHRLTKTDNGGKYRPEMAGLPLTMFNADVLGEGDWMIVLVEGEVKTMVLSQYGFSTIGIPGANSFKDKWVKLFPKEAQVYIALDPGAEQQADEIGLTLAGNGVASWVCTLPVKPDDFFVKYNGKAGEFCKFLSLGRKVKP